MPRSLLPILAALVLTGSAAMAQTPMAAAPARANLGGGFLEFLFGGHGASAPTQPVYATAPVKPALEQRTANHQMDPQFLRQEVAYNGKEAPGTIVVDTPDHFLYLVEADGKAMRYGIGVARTGFAWSGVHKITAKKEWPSWTPPKEMLARQPYLPRVMPGGPGNPLGARALYIGSTLYRIHGSNEPWTIGHNVSSGCIRLRNADIIDLYNRVKVGTEVVVIGPHGSDRDYIPPVTTDPTKVEHG